MGGTGSWLLAVILSFILKGMTENLIAKWTRDVSRLKRLYQILHSFLLCRILWLQFPPLLYSVTDGERIKFEVAQEVLMRWSYNYGNCSNKNQNMVNVLCIVFHKNCTRKGICDIFTFFGLYLGELLQWNLSLTLQLR